MSNVALRMADANHKVALEIIGKLNENDPLRKLFTILAMQAFTGELAHSSMESMERVLFARLNGAEERITKLEMKHG